MKALFIILFLLAILYLGIGVITRFLYCKKHDSRFEVNEESIKYILMWPKHL